MHSNHHSTKHTILAIMIKCFFIAKLKTKNQIPIIKHLYIKKHAS